MKNRLEISKTLLKTDGIIFVQCDNNEQAYLKVLLDEIFERANFVTTLHVQMSTTQGMKVRAAQNGNVVKNGEYIHIYSKNGKKNIAKHLIYDIREDYDTHYSYYIKEDGSINPLIELYNYKFPNDLSNKKPLNLQEAFKYSKEFAEIVCLDKIGNISVDYGQLSKERYIKFVNNGKEYLFRLSDSWGSTDSYKFPEGLRKIRGDWWPEFYLDMGNIKKEGNANFSNGKKPERLISQIIKMVTSPNDIVLDFFMGSGITQAVAMKMNRRFIGVEQMDYINTVSVARLQKIIDGEQGGISESVGWQGGGYFVYAELMEKGQTFINQIQNAKSDKDLNAIFQKMKTTDDINFKVDLEKFEATRNELSFTEQQKILCEMIDKNQLYYNERNIDDEDIRKQISDSDYKFNKSFYGKEE